MASLAQSRIIHLRSTRLAAQSCLKRDAMLAYNNSGLEGRRPSFYVPSAGHGRLALAGHLALMGFDLKLYNRTEERLWLVQQRGRIKLTGEVEGFEMIGRG